MSSKGISIGSRTRFVSSLQESCSVPKGALDQQLSDEATVAPELREQIAEEWAQWVLMPASIVAAGISAGLIAGEGFAEPPRLLPLLAFALPSAFAYRLRRAERWVSAAAVLCGAATLTAALTISLNGSYPPAYCLGVLSAMATVTLFGWRWGMLSAVSLMLSGVAWSVLAGQGYVTAFPSSDSMSHVLCTAIVALAIGMVARVQQLQGRALRDAVRPFAEPEAEAEVELEAEDLQSAAEPAFHSVFDQASVGMLLLTSTGHITRLNPRAAALLGHGDNTLAACRLPLAPSWNEEQSRLLQEAVEQAALGHACRHELTLDREAGPSPVLQVTLSPFVFESGSVEHVLVEVVDVTDLVEARSMLDQARRLEALGKLSGGVAHDLNNMLTAILAACDLVRLSKGDARKIADNVELIQSSVLRAASLTKQLLAFGRKDRWNSEQLDANRLVNEVASLLQRTLHKNIELVIVPGDQPVYVRADAASLEHALLNLALNAQDAMPRGGTLTISCRPAVLDRATCARTNGELEPGPCVVISVEDTGTGISQDVREHMFEPFFTTKAPGKGTGLGLAAVHGTVRGHRGGIAVASQEGIGTQIAMILPAIKAGPSLVRETTDAKLPSDLHARVLLADDEDLARTSTAALLEDMGCQVQSVRSGNELIDALAEGADPDIIVSDLAMPGLGGVRLVQTLEAMRPHCALLLITGFTGDDVSSARPSRRGRRLLRKPFSRAELLKALSELLVISAAEPRRRRRTSVSPRPDSTGAIPHA